MKKIILLFCLYSINSIYAQVPTYVPTNGLIAYYPFNGNANDVSGNGNNGTINGANLTNDRINSANSAINCTNSNSYIRTQSVIQNVANTFTISFWANPQQADLVRPQGVVGNESTGTMTVINPPHGSNWGDISQNAGVGVNVGTNQIQIVEHTHLYVASPLVYPTNINGWHHIVVVYNQHIPKLYLDGILVATGLQSNIPNVRPGNGFDSWYGQSGFGSSFNPNGNPIGQYKGNFDDIGIWNRALTQEEITNLYTADNTCQSLVINTGLLSFNPPTYTNTVTIYPNPANDHITIDCGALANVSSWNIKITNILGQEVFNQPMNTQQYVIPLNTWTGQGVYFVKIYDAQGTLVNTKKIILQ